MFKKPNVLLSIAAVLFLTAGVLATGLFIKTPVSTKEHAAAATQLSVFPHSENLAPGNNFTFSVVMDTGSNAVTGVDLLLKFDPKIIQVSSLAKGSGIAALNNNINNNFDDNAGTISYTVFTLDKSQAVSGSNVQILQVNARINSDANLGNSYVTFDSSTAVSATGETQSVVTSESPGTLIIASTTPTPTATATATPTPTATATATGAPNSCGGTCGSNYNCGANLYCYQGYCRNPSCSWSNDCNCNDATASPIPTATAKSSIATPVPTSQVINLTPQPTVNNFWENVASSPSATPTIKPINLTKSSTSNFLPWIIGSLIVAGLTLVFIVIGIYKSANENKPKPPVIGV